MKNIYLIILNFNGFQDITKCLKSLICLKSNLYRLQTIIVDNGSSDLELTKLKHFLEVNSRDLAYLGIRLVENGQNLGFARGNNVAIRIAVGKEADYILLLNNDVVLEMNFLKNALKIGADIVSPAVKFREFKDKNKLLYDLGGFVNLTTGRTTHLNLYRDKYNRFKGRGPIEVDYVAGCCMLIKRSVFESVGMLDEKYFIYFEDVDFCLSAKKKGFRVVVDPASYIYHKLGGSMDRWSNRAIFHNLYSNFIFISKHLGVRRLTGYGYLFFLTAKIIKDRFVDRLIGTPLKRQEKKKWRGARHSKLL